MQCRELYDFIHYLIYHCFEFLYDWDMLYSSHASLGQYFILFQPQYLHHHVRQYLHHRPKECLRQRFTRMSIAPVSVDQTGQATTTCRRDCNALSTTRFVCFTVCKRHRLDRTDWWTCEKSQSVRQRYTNTGKSRFYQRQQYWIWRQWQANTKAIDGARRIVSVMSLDNAFHTDYPSLFKQR